MATQRASDSRGRVKTKAALRTTTLSPKPPKTPEKVSIPMLVRRCDDELQMKVAFASGESSDGKLNYDIYTSIDGGFILRLEEGDDKAWYRMDGADFLVAIIDYHKALAKERIPHD